MTIQFKIGCYLVSCLFVLPLTLFAKPLDPHFFWQKPNIQGIALSPNGRFLASIVRNKDLLTVSIRDLEKEGNPVMGVMDGVVMQPKRLAWASNKRLLIEVYVPYGANNLIKKKEKGKKLNLEEYLGTYRTVSVSPQANDLVVLMEDHIKTRTRYWRRDKPRVSDLLPGDADHVLMSKKIRHARRGTRGLYRVNIFTGKGEKIAEGGRYTAGFMSDRSGQLRYRYDLHFRTRLMIIYQHERGKWNEIAQVPLDFENDNEEFDPSALYSINQNGDLIYRKVNPKTGFYGFYKRSLKTGELSEVFSREDQDLAGLIKDRNGELLGYYTETDIIHSHLVDSKKQEHYKQMFQQAKQQMLIVDYSSEKRKVVLSVGRDNRGIYYLYDEEEKQLTLFGERYSDLETYNQGLPATVRYRARDNTLIQAYALFPPNFKMDQPAPMVLLPHGGPFSRDRGGYHFLAQYIASRGYIVLQPNFRGSTGYGKNFEEAGHKQFGGIMLDDMEDGVEFMIKKGFANPKQVCVVGISYGGYAALMSIAKTPKRYQCAVSINGVSDLKQQIEYTTNQLKKYYKKVPQELRQKLLNNFYKSFGEPSVDTKYFTKDSPINYINKIQTPTLIITGNKDFVVPYTQGKKMYKALKRAGKKSKYIEVHGAYHSLMYWFPNALVKEQEVIDVYEELETFLLQNISPG